MAEHCSRALNAVAQVDQAEWARAGTGQGRDRPSRLLEPGLSMGTRPGGGAVVAAHTSCFAVCPPAAAFMSLALPSAACPQARAAREELSGADSHFLAHAASSAPCSAGLRPLAFCGTSIVSGIREDITPVYWVPVRLLPEEWALSQLVLVRV